MFTKLFHEHHHHHQQNWVFAAHKSTALPLCQPAWLLFCVTTETEECGGTGNAITDEHVTILHQLNPFNIVIN
jgi:hypothetical protein